GRVVIVPGHAGARRPTRGLLLHTSSPETLVLDCGWCCRWTLDGSVPNRIRGTDQPVSRSARIECTGRSVSRQWGRRTLRTLPAHLAGCQARPDPSRHAIVATADLTSSRPDRRWAPSTERGGQPGPMASSPILSNLGPTIAVADHRLHRMRRPVIPDAVRWSGTLSSPSGPRLALRPAGEERDVHPVFRDRPRAGIPTRPGVVQHTPAVPGRPAWQAGAARLLD